MCSMRINCGVSMLFGCIKFPGNYFCSASLAGAVPVQLLGTVLMPDALFLSPARLQHMQIALSFLSRTPLVTLTNISLSLSPAHPLLV
jgi:hypothetical protein